MVTKVKELKNNFKDHCKYIADEIYNSYYSDNPEYDILDMAIDILNKYVSTDDFVEMDDNFFSKESIKNILLKQPSERVEKIENDLSKHCPRYIKYSDVDNFNNYINRFLNNPY